MNQKQTKRTAGISKQDHSRKALLTLMATSMVAGVVVPVATELPGVMTAEAFSGGNGTASSPYIISTPSQLASIPAKSVDHFRLSNDLDLSGIAWTPIGTTSTNAFKGVFDGNGKTITGLNIDSKTDHTGLFGYISAGTVKDLSFLDASIKSTKNWTGILAGTVVGESKLSNIEVSGVVSSNGSNTGGLAGRVASDSASIQNVTAAGQVFGTINVGGIIGYHQGNLENAYATNDVSGTDKVGGLVGQSYGKTNTKNVYANGSVAGVSSVGGIFGSYTADVRASLNNAYALNTSVQGDSDFGKVLGSIYLSQELQGEVSNVYVPETSRLGSGNKAITGLLTNREILDGGVYRRLSSASTAWAKDDISQLPYLRFSSNRPNSLYLSEKITTSQKSDTIVSMLYDADDLKTMGNTSGETFYLANDIDLSGSLWEPLGEFKSRLEGNNKEIKNMTIVNNKSTMLGFFERLSANAVVKDLKLTNAKITSTYNGFNAGRVGILAALSASAELIENVGVSGTIDAQTSNAGGLFGKSSNTKVIKNVYSEGSIVGNVNIVGGLIGDNIGDSVENAYSSMDITASMDAGGLFGSSSSVKIANVYATGKIVGGRRAGGLVGNLGWTVRSSFVNGYALNSSVVGPVAKDVGTAFGSISTSDINKPEKVFSIVNMKGEGHANGVTSEINAQAAMRKSTYQNAGFVFSSTGWGIKEGSSLPYLSFSPSFAEYDPGSGGFVEPDKVAPAGATLQPNTTTITNQNISVTIQYPDSTSSKEYKIGASGTWTEYKGPVTLSTNGEIFARSKKISSDWSPVTSLVVANIDKTAPGKATITSNNEALTKNPVQLAVQFATDADIAKNEIRIGSGEWTVYTGPLTFSENQTLYARSTDKAGNVSSTTSYSVSNIDNVAPTIKLTPSTTELTREDVTVRAVVSDNRSVAVKKWANGNQSAAHFATGGTVLTGNDFTVQANGTYTVYAQDSVGNETVETIVVSNIDKSQPANATLAANVTKQTNGTVAVTITYPTSGVTKEYRTDNGTWETYTGPVEFTKNGTVEARSANVLGTYSDVTQYAVTNIDTVGPTIQLTPSTTGQAIDQLTVSAAVSDDVAVSVKKWAVGNQTTSYFSSKGTTLNTQFTVTDNGEYTVYARDTAGNESVEVITISNIEKAPKAPTVQPDITEWTDGKVHVTIAFPDDAVRKEVKIDKIEQKPVRRMMMFGLFGLEDEGWQEYTEPIEITENVTITARSFGANGLESEHTTLTVQNIDTVLPVIEQVDLINNFLVVDATDAESGIDTIEVSLNGGNFQPYAKDRIDILEDSVVLVRVTDKAGNWIEENFIAQYDPTPQQFALNWFEDQDAIAYKILRNGQEIGRVNAPTTRYVDVNVVPGKLYTYHVVSVYADETESTPKPPKVERQPFDPAHPDPNKPKPTPDPVDPKDPVTPPDKEPTDPKDPVIPPDKEPTDPKDPVDPPDKEPTDPVIPPDKEPTEPKDPVDPPDKEPTDPKDPTEQPDPDKPDKEDPVVKPLTKPAKKITIHKGVVEIAWGAIAGANRYEVYRNGVLLDTIPDDGRSTYSYTFPYDGTVGFLEVIPLRDGEEGGNNGTDPDSDEAQDHMFQQLLDELQAIEDFVVGTELDELALLNQSSRLQDILRESASLKKEEHQLAVSTKQLSVKGIVQQFSLAVEAVESAELAVTSKTLQAARLTVEPLLDGGAKTALQQRLDTIQVLVDQNEESDALYRTLLDELAVIEQEILSGIPTTEAREALRSRIVNVQERAQAIRDTAQREEVIQIGNDLLALLQAVEDGELELLPDSSLKDDLEAVETATKAVEQAERTILRTDADTANTLVAALKESDLKTALLERMVIVEQKITQLTTATTAVEQAESTMQQTDLDEAKVLVNALWEDTRKTALLDRLDMLQEVINDRLALEAATTAVEKAEFTITQADVDAARLLVEALHVTESQTALSSRLDGVQAKVLQLAEATASVELAESTIKQLDVNTAKVFVQTLWEDPRKTDLLKRLDAIQKAIDERNALQSATQAVEQAESRITQSDVDAAETLVNALVESSPKDALNVRLQVVKDQLVQLATATIAVEQAESTIRQMDVDAARLLVNALWDDPRKEALLARLDAVQVVIDQRLAELEKQAEDAVSKAEESKKQPDVDEAQDVIDQLPDGPKKEDLQDRIDQVQDEIDKATSLARLIAEAIAAVERAEASVTQTDVNLARTNVGYLPPLAIKTELTDRLDVVQRLIDARDAYAKALAAAIQAVETAEKFPTQYNVQKAEDALSALKNGSDKDGLRVRLDAVIKGMLLADVEKLVSSAEKYKESFNNHTYFDKAQTAVTAMPAMPEKEAFQARLDAIQAEMDNAEEDRLYEAALKKVIQAERYERDPYLTDAQTLVNKLRVGEPRQGLQDRIDAILKKLQDIEDAKNSGFDELIKDVLDKNIQRQFRIVHNAMTRAEKYGYKSSVRHANNRFNALPAAYNELYPEMMAHLQVRMDAVNEKAAQGPVDDDRTPVQIQAEAAVEKAEQYGTASRIRTAQSEIDTLEDGEFKTDLQKRLNLLKEVGVDEMTKDEKDADRKVASAEKSPITTRFRPAQAAINKLPAGDFRDDLQERLDIAMGIIKKEE